MPWGDRTGPLGAGPRTGRGLGYCSGNTVPGYMVGGYGFGWGRGFGAAEAEDLEEAGALALEDGVMARISILQQLPHPGMMKKGYWRVRSTH